jgi:hypothetical protein
VATTFGEDEMFIFGGRGKGGVYLNDCWTFNIQTEAWTNITPTVASHANQNHTNDDHIDLNLSYRELKIISSRESPSPRSFATCVTINDKIYLFGGTDGVHNFCDLWVFDIMNKIWEKSFPGEFCAAQLICLMNMRSPTSSSFIVGPPPSPRYGHQMIVVESIQRYDGKTKQQSKRRKHIAIIGGCCVSPESEMTAGEISTYQFPTTSSTAMTIASSTVLSPSTNQEKSEHFPTSLKSKMNRSNNSATFKEQLLDDDLNESWTGESVVEHGKTINDMDFKDLVKIKDNVVNKYLLEGSYAHDKGKVIQHLTEKMKLKHGDEQLNDIYRTAAATASNMRILEG